MSGKERSKRIYTFGNRKAEGTGDMKELLGGKGANLAEMSRIGLHVPPGFTITTDTCNEYQEMGRDKVVKLLSSEINSALENIEDIMGSKFGDAANPLLVSVRSGARVSMPGMMDTVLNVGLNDEVVKGLAQRTGKERFAWDSYRRFIQMYGDVVMRVNTFRDSEHNIFEEIIDELKQEKGIEEDRDFTLDDLQELVKRFKTSIRKLSGKDFPEHPADQLWNAVMAVFDSWMIPRAMLYRKLHGYPEDWGTAVNVQAMVFGNMGSQSCSGVAFTRDASTGENRFNGEYLVDAQGEDVVAGIRTPLQITREGSSRWASLAGISEEVREKMYPSLEEYLPEVYKELFENQHTLENHFHDMQDMEFTVQEGRLWILQTRSGKRTGAAMVRIAMEMLTEGLINEKTALRRIEPKKLNELLHPVFDQASIKKAEQITQGLPASPGAASGQICFLSEEAIQKKEQGLDVVLVRIETSADDLPGMSVANGILTARGGMTSHAAVVARGMGKCCISGAGSLRIDYGQRKLSVNGNSYRDGDWISLDGNTGNVFKGKVKTKAPEVSGDFEELMKLADKHARLEVRTNADTPDSARKARSFGARGIGLCRTEHMFFQEERIMAMREMIIATDEAGRRKALEKLLPMQREDFEGIFEAMESLPVTIRLLDPPLHEFVPHDEQNQKELAKEAGISLGEVQEKIHGLKEVNPMLGHRGCRLGNTYPEITQMQTRAILEAALELKRKGIKAVPEIMVPLTGTLPELIMQEHIIREEAQKVFEEKGDSIEFKVGTMIEIPRAALVADQIASHAEFFSFGTNDLTQMTYGYSRDDAGRFMKIYEDKGILKSNPFQTVDQEGVGQLVEMGTQRGRETKADLKVGICGEHGGDPESIEFFDRAGLNYVSCSPFRVPIARISAAQAKINR